MHHAETLEMSAAFFPVWQAAARHLRSHGPGAISHWLRAHPYPPMAEHLSFGVGNQLFFVRVEDAGGELQGPGTRQHLRAIAQAARGHACVLPMQRRTTWTPVHPGWGLVDAASGLAVDPLACVSAEPIEMSPWEHHHLAVQVVRDHVEGQGLRLVSWQGSPEFDPSLWFVPASGALAWAVVRTALHPEGRARPPPHWQQVVERCAPMGATGYFASVVLAGAERPRGGAPRPLWRGRAFHAHFQGLEPAAPDSAGMP